MKYKQEKGSENLVYIYIRDEFYKFPDIFEQAFKIVVDSWKFSMLLLYILWDDWPIFMNPGFKWTGSKNWNTPYKTLIVTAGEFQKCNLDVRALWKNDMQQNNVLNLEKIPQKRMKCFRLLLEHLAWIEN